MNPKMKRIIFAAIAISTSAWGDLPARKGDAVSVVLEKNQFASSLHNYKESRRRDFLCPKDAKLWELIWSAIHTKAKSEIPTNAFHYYFFRHSERFQPPAWAQGPKSYTPVALEISEGEKPCVRAYVNSAWK